MGTLNLFFDDPHTVCLQPLTMSPLLQALQHIQTAMNVHTTVETDVLLTELIITNTISPAQRAISAAQRAADDIREIISVEFALCAFVCERYPKNYYGWLHRQWVIEVFMQSTPKYSVSSDLEPTMLNNAGSKTSKYHNDSNII